MTHVASAEIIAPAAPDPPAAPARLPLAVVMPVHNEQDCILTVIQDWLAALQPLTPDFTLIVIDDGSTDRTPGLLDALTGTESRLRVIHQPQAGHGPAILRGYRLAVTLADWVFQVDSDDELRPGCFAPFWRRRAGLDMLFGIRTGRRQSPSRRLLTRSAAIAQRLCFGRALPDPNVPFRLMRAAALAPLLDRISPATLAPNVLIGGLAARAGLRLDSLPIRCRPRATGHSSLAGLRILRLAARAAWQTATHATTSRS